MMVDRIGHIEPLQPGKKTGRTESVQGSDRTDSISLSSEAIEKAEKYQVVELIKATPETDEARIAELRAKINDPSYINEQIVQSTADKIMESWLL
ncbi:MAG TPA: flagellar biosynthesis protein FlgM [Treponema sp.]|nr:flagellar biosynthesis protein FlgM [Treponema sp.]